MSNWGSQITGNSYPLNYAAGTRDGTVIRFFNAVYAWMAVGLAVTASVAWLVSTHRAAMAPVLSAGSCLGIFVAEIVLVLVISRAVRKINATVATGLFVLFAALNGLMLSFVFIRYSLPSITGAFVASAAMFGAMSLWGMFTKTDLTGMGKILFMALIGLIVASVVNLFVASSVLYWVVSYAGVFIFAGLTAYDTQQLQTMAVQLRGDVAMSARMSVVGALMLYLDFINMFLYLLQIFGSKD